MKAKFSSSWKASKRPNKQRKYVFNAPTHMRRKFLGAHLTPSLRKEHGKRSFALIVGDTVKIMRGKFKGKENKVSRVDGKKLKVFVTGVDRSKKDGSKVDIPLQPSNLMITTLKLDDKRRKAALARKAGSVQSKAAAEPAREPAKQAEVKEPVKTGGQAK